jgi:hypothetical protein
MINDYSDLSLIECIRPLHAVIVVGWVWKHQTRLECGQRLPRKLRNTVLILASSYAVARTQ